MAKTADQASRILRRIADDLERPTALEEAYARAVLDQALQNAAGRPTPQAPMAAAALGVQGNSIRSLAGGAPAEVATGSEFGSSIYRQFGPRDQRGYWLYPAAEDPSVIDVGDRMLEEIMDAAIRGGF